LAARAAGLSDFVIDLGHARIAGALMAGANAGDRRTIFEALTVKDTSEVVRRAQASGLGTAEQRALASLTELHGGADVWPRAGKALAGTGAEAPLAELRQIWEAAQLLALAPEIVVDLGEIRNFAYYTGTTFQIHARGPGRPLASGGRYDGLLEGFGLPRPAAGFAFGLDDLGWALGTLSGEAEPARVLLAPSAASLAQALRAAGIACADAPAADALAYARAWRYSHMLEISDQALLTRVSDQKSWRVAPEPAALLAALREPK
jgi:ATP phosphoribosyltransferase regulatory subunit